MGSDGSLEKVAFVLPETSYQHTASPTNTVYTRDFKIGGGKNDGTAEGNSHSYVDAANALFNSQAFQSSITNPIARNQIKNKIMSNQKQYFELHDASNYGLYSHLSSLMKDYEDGLRVAQRERKATTFVQSKPTFDTCC